MEVGVKMQKSKTHNMSHIAAVVCSTCLAADRELFSLENSPQYLQICNGLSLSRHDAVCFECRARLRSMVRFQTRALRAQERLACWARRRRRLKRNSTMDASLECLSTLREIAISSENTINVVSDSVRLMNESQISRLSTTTLILVPPFVSTPAVPTDEEIKEEGCEVTEDFVCEAKSEDFACEAKSETAEKGDSDTDTASEDDGRCQPRQQPLQAEDFVVRQIRHSEVVAHMERERDSERFKRARFKCRQCALVFYTEGILNKHSVLHSDVSNIRRKTQGPYKCKICEQRFKSKDTLEIHTAAHYRRYECRKCDRVEYVYQKINWHYISAHDDTPRYCGKCPARFTRFADMRHHARTAHVADFSCRHCDRVFAANYTLQHHIRMKHKKVASVECEVCHKRYKGQSNLLIHARSAHAKVQSGPNENAYCAECDLQFKDVYQYRSHVKNTSRHVAADAFRYECDHCGKRFVQKQNVRHHIELMHLKLDKYGCDVCGECFPTSLYRSRHKRLKHSEKPRKKYVCHICGKSFSIRKSLEQHMNTHFGLRPFVCKHCGATFAYSAALYMHNRLVHLKRKRGKTKDAKQTPSSSTVTE